MSAPRSESVPTSEPFLPFALPSITDAEIHAVTEVLRSGWLTTGPRCRQFEADFATYVGSPHALALNSCTAALHLALEALEIQPDEEVLVPTLTFAASAEVVRYLQARPVLIDCDPVTLNISPQALSRYLAEQAVLTEDGCRNSTTGARIRAIILVHYAGLACDMEAILQLAQEYWLEVVEDAAHGFPATYRGKQVGTFGKFGAYSFYANKTITTGEGGMLVSEDEALIRRARMMSLHGLNRDAWLRFTAQGSWYYEIVAPGFKYNLTDIGAALGIEQLKRAEELRQARERIAEFYLAALADVSEIILPARAAPGDLHSWHLFVIRLELERLQIDRARFIEELKARGIGTSVHYIPLHLHPYYRETYGYQPDDLPVASQIAQQVISLPIYPNMTEADAQRVAHAVAEIARCHRA